MLDPLFKKLPAISSSSYLLVPGGYLWQGRLKGWPCGWLDNDDDDDDAGDDDDDDFCIVYLSKRCILQHIESSDIF